SYNWSNTDIDSIAQNLSASTYSLTVTDNNGCSVDSSVIITQPDLLSASISNLNVSCNGGNDGQATVTVNGGTSPYSYNWSNGDTTPTADSLTAGTYTITITDSLGCSWTDSITISQPQPLDFTFSQVNVSCNTGNDGQASVTVTGGALPFNYLWSTTEISNAINGLTANTYSLTVTDNNG
ncbi:adhesin, partial [Vicingus serpentipes]